MPAKTELRATTLITMRYLSQLCLLLVIIAGGAARDYCQGRIVTVDEPPSWKEFAPPDGGFSVQFPGTPVTRTVQRQTSKGKITTQTFTLELKDSFYYVSYLDYADGSDDPAVAKELLDAGRDRTFGKNKKTKALNERELKLGSFSGREFLVLQDQSAFGIFRTYVVRNRLYEIAMLAPTEVVFDKKPVSSGVEDRTDYFNSIAHKFFSSFEIPAANETMGEIELKLHELQKQDRYQGVLTLGGRATSGEPIKQDIINGSAIRLVTPPYPVMARAAHAGGPVRVHVLIDLDGNVAAAEIVDGHPLLRPAALKAARESKFTATKFEGKTVMVSGVIIYNFVAQ